MAWIWLPVWTYRGSRGESDEGDSQTLQIEEGRADKRFRHSAYKGQPIGQFVSGKEKHHFLIPGMVWGSHSGRQLKQSARCRGFGEGVGKAIDVR